MEEKISQPTSPIEQVSAEPKNKSGLLVIAILLIVILLLAGGVVFGMQIEKRKVKVWTESPLTESTPQACTTEAKICPDGSSVGRTGPDCEFAPCPKQVPSIDEKSYTEDTTVPGQKRYVSPKLGISFLFAGQVPDVGVKVLVKEVGDKVYIYGDNMEYDKGQYVEIFQKDKTQSLKEAIQEKIMKGFSSDKCMITTDNPFSIYPVNYEIANIKVVGNFDDLEKMEIMRKDCPSYTQSNGMSYFLSDKNHPDKFVFFSIGQYLINKAPTGEGGWQDTIEFLD